MCLFRNKDIFGIKLSIIEKGVSKEFWRSANSLTLQRNGLPNMFFILLIS